MSAPIIDLGKHGIVVAGERPDGNWHVRKPRFGERCKLALKTLIGGQVLNRYEAGQRYTTRRSYLPGWVQDARFDADTASRQEILRKARYWERNSPIVNRLLDLFEQYVSGPNGPIFTPTSSDEEWNKRFKGWWNKWCEMCDLTSRQHFGTLCGQAARRWAVDGETFILKTRGKERMRGQSFPRIQLVESHRIGDPGGAFATTASKRVDGIDLDPNGRPVKYWMLDDNRETYIPKSAEEVIHLFEPSRPGMQREVSLFHAVLNTIHDLDDLKLLEMDAAKDAAQVTNVIKTKTGELNADEFRRERWGVSGTTGTSGGSAQNRTQYYDEVFKGRAKVLEYDDEFQQFMTTRPSVASQQYWDLLASEICCGFGISKLLVFPWSVQGTVVRADLDTTASFFRSRSAVLISSMLDVYYYAAEWATQNVLELSDPPADWRSVSVRPPRSVTVDVGRKSAALIDEYKAGWLSLESICGELGEDWRAVLRQRAIERKAARDLETEFALAPGELIGAALEAVKQTAPSQQAPMESVEA